MQEDRKRRLAAIMFADMVGYTALMQRNEREGLEKVHRFSKVMEEASQSKAGEILEFRGDGCLLVFDSAVNAMYAAKEIQAKLQQAPQVPIRIGIHIGDIVFTQGNIYGDGVNLASRVESMGVPASVLFTERVLHDVKSHPEFEVTSLGQYQFKNVEKPMEIFALANEGLVVPKAEDMLGKGKRIEESNDNTSSREKRQWIRWGLRGFVAAALGALLFLAYSFGSKSKVPDAEQLRAERIAVLPFENKTNDASLDNLGDMAADWINRGLMEIGDAEVVSPATARMHRDAIGIRPNDPQGRATFAKLTGAQNLIKGNFYEDKGELVFNLELQDAEDGSLRRTFDPVKGQAGNKEKLITQLRESICGYWLARDLVDDEQIRPPKYEAYSAYLDALKTWPVSNTRLQEIIELDSNFYLPRLNFLNLNRHGTFGPNRPHFDFLERNKEHLSSYEKAWYQFFKSYFKGDALDAFQTLNDLRQKYPQDIILNHEAASIALEGLHNPEIALDIYQNISAPDKSYGKKLGVYYYYIFHNKIFSYAYLNKAEEIKNLLTSFENSGVDFNRVMGNAVFLLGSLGIADSSLTNKAIDEMHKYAEDDPFNFIFYFVITDRTKLISDKQREKIYRKSSEFLNSLDSQHLLRTLYVNRKAFVEANPSNLQLDLRHVPLITRIINFNWAARCYIHQAQFNQLESVIEKLEEDLNTSLDQSSNWGAGWAHYILAELYVQIDQQELALDHLRNARKLGVAKYLTFFEYDRHLKGLYNHPEFQELIQPIWPEGYGK